MGTEAFPVLKTDSASGPVVRQLRPDAVRERLRTADAGSEQLLDVREPWEYERARLPGAVLVPIAKLPSRLREFDPHAPLIVYCHHGIRSWHAACFLVANGFETVINLAGGIDAWSREIDPTVPRY